MSMKNSNDTNGNWTPDLPTCSAVPQPTTPPRTSASWKLEISRNMQHMTSCLSRGNGSTNIISVADKFLAILLLIWDLRVRMFFFRGFPAYSFRCWRAPENIPRLLFSVIFNSCWSHLPRGPRRRSTAVRLLRSWVRIPPGAWTFVYCECCVCCQVEVSVTSWPLVQGSPTDRGASLCVTSKPHEWGARIKQAEPLGEACSK